MKQTDFQLDLTSVITADDPMAQTNRLMSCAVR